MTPEQEQIVRAATNRYLQAKATADLLEDHLRELHAMAALGSPAEQEEPEGVEEEPDA